MENINQTIEKAKNHDQQAMEELLRTYKPKVIAISREYFLIGADFDDLMENTIKQFEDADYDVRVKFCPAEPNESAARVVARELEGGQLINSTVVFSFGMKPQEVYEKLAPMTNAKGETYGYFEEDEQQEAA